MNPLKRFCFVVSLGYFALAVLVQLKVWDAVFFQLPWFLPPLHLSEAFCGLLLVGFLTLFVGTIFIKNKEKEDVSEADENSGTVRRAMASLVSMAVFINVAINFFVFATNTSSDHGTPARLSDGRYVMSYRTEIIREMDEAAYYRELSSYQNKTRMLFTAVMLLFTWGMVTAHMPETNPKNKIK